MSELTKVRIRAWLQCGVISDEFLPLDGVVYYAIVRNELGPQEVTSPGETLDLSGRLGGLRGAMPFRLRQRKRRHWYYACSFAQWPDHAVEGLDHWSKRLDLQHSDLIDFRGRRGTVAIGSGMYKAYRMPVFYRHALYVEWYAVANRESLERSLAFCTHLGKKTSQGWGAVLRWEVTAWPEDWHMEGPGGRLMRARYEPRSGVIYGVRPSYWHPRHQFPVELPAAGSAGASGIGL